MRFYRNYSYVVVQPHLGANGTYFDAGTLMETSDYLRAILLARCNIYNGETLGEVKSIRLIDELCLEKEGNK